MAVPKTSLLIDNKAANVINMSERVRRDKRSIAIFNAIAKEMKIDKHY